MRYSSRCVRFAMVLAAVSLGACTKFATRETKLQGVKTIGIISAIGDEMRFVRTGLTGFNNTSQHLPIPSWGLDDLIVQQATTALSGRFQVQPVNYKRDVFAAIKESSVTPVNFGRNDPFKKLVRTDVSPQGLDAYIIISKARASLAGSGRKVEGVGLITHNTAVETYSLIHALYEITVIDGKTFDTIEKSAAAPLDQPAPVRLAGPTRSISASNGDPENLRQAVVEIIERSLPATLGDMRLTGGR